MLILFLLPFWETSNILLKFDRIHWQEARSHQGTTPLPRIQRVNCCGQAGLSDNVLLRTVPQGIGNSGSMVVLAWKRLAFLVCPLHLIQISAEISKSDLGRVRTVANEGRAGHRRSNAEWLSSEYKEWDAVHLISLHYLRYGGLFPGKLVKVDLDTPRRVDP